MSGYLFDFEDEDTDTMQIRRMLDSLVFDSLSTRNTAQVSVRLYRTDVIELHTALGAWLAENGEDN